MMSVENENGGEFGLSFKSVSALREMGATEEAIGNVRLLILKAGGVRDVGRRLVSWPCGCQALQLEVLLLREGQDFFTLNACVIRCRGRKCSRLAELDRA